MSNLETGDKDYFLITARSARNVFCQSILLQHLLHLLWYERQLCNVFLKLHLGNAAQFMTQSQGKEGKNHHLTGKRLG